MSKHDEQMKRLAREAFETHEITSTGENRWTLKRADDDDEECELFCANADVDAWNAYHAEQVV